MTARIGHYRQGTHGQEDNGSNERQNEHETQHPSSSFPLIVVGRSQLFACRGDIVVDRNDVALDVVFAKGRIGSAGDNACKASAELTDHTTLFLDNLAEISEDLVQLVYSAFDLPDIRLSLRDKRFLESQLFWRDTVSSDESDPRLACRHQDSWYSLLLLLLLLHLLQDQSVPLTIGTTVIVLIPYLSILDHIAKLLLFLPHHRLLSLRRYLLNSLEPRKSRCEVFRDLRL